MAGLDRQRLARLLPYLGRDRRRLGLTLLLLIPVAFAAALPRPHSRWQAAHPAHQ